MTYQQFFVPGIFVAALIAVFYLTTPSKPIGDLIEVDSPTVEHTPATSTVVETTSPKAVGSITKAAKTALDNADRISRFETIRKKVLLNREETSEREKILSDRETVQWAESYLSAVPKNTSEVKKHFSAIDFLEEAIAWKENPIRSEALEGIESAILTNQLAQTKREARKLVVGDKIDLFTVLAQEEPAKARALLTNVQDPWLRDILNYAVKRLSLEKKLSEVQ